MEQVIVDLEDRLKEIESQLQEATESQDFEVMTRLGDEHVQIQSELEQRLEEWEA
jgi:CII-binding regulator of phage lambda lysogenization HflD